MKHCCSRKSFSIYVLLPAACMAISHAATAGVLTSPFSSKAPAESTAYRAADRVGAAPSPATAGNLGIADFNTVRGAVTAVQVQNTSGLAQSNVPVTFGQAFAAGDVPAGASVVGLVNGSTIATQTDVKATYPDGSARHAVISMLVPELAAGQTQLIGLLPVSSPAGQSSGQNPADLSNAGFSTSVNVTLNGQTYSASADALLGSGAYKTWLAGPMVSEWLVSAPLKNAQGVAHPHLTARFAVRSYARSGKAKVDVILENNWAYEAGPQNFTYDAQVLVGGQPAYSKTALTHYHHARWRKSFWWGGADPKAHVIHNTAYLIKAKALPNYDPSVVISATELNSIKTRFSGSAAEPMGIGLATAYMPQTGGRPDVGLIPGWTVSYLYSMDKGVKDAAVGTGELGGSWSIHYRDKNTDLPVRLKDHPYMTVKGRLTDTLNPVTKKYEAVPPCGGDCSTPHTADLAHQPGLAYIPYLVTGDHYLLEELQFWATYNAVEGTPAYRGFDKGLVKYNQVRGQAWTLRTLAEAAFITPDNDPLKSDFTAFLSNNLDWFNANYTDNVNANALGVIVNGHAITYNDNRGLAPWQDDFFTSAVGRAVELGFSKAKTLLSWKSKFPVGRMTGAGYCWIKGAIYSLNVRDTASSPFYTTFAQAYQGSHTPAFNALSCASTEMAASLGLKVGEMSGYSSSNVGMPSNMQPALAYSVDIRNPNGAKAWSVFSGRSVKPDYSTGAQFAIVPR